MHYLISVPIENQAVANQLAAANFADSANTFTNLGSALGKLPATHSYCGVALEVDAHTKVLQLLQVVQGSIEPLDLDNPSLSFQKLNLKPIVIEK